MRYLCFDISNMLYRTFFAKKDEDDKTLAGLATHMALTTLNKYFKQFKPDQVVMAFDRPSWRKDYTASENCISKRPYKGNRRKDMSPSQQAKYQRFLNHLAEFEKLITEHTTIISLAGPKLEADDLIAGFVQIYNSPDNEIIIISSDSDLLQLIKHDNVRIISPATDKELQLDDWDNDPEFYLFAKCVKGDSTDNVQSAFPRVRKNRLRAAYTDPFERVQLMKEKWSDHNEREFVVEELFVENQTLIDLEKQPIDIRAQIYTTVESEVDRDRKFSFFFIMQYLGKYELRTIQEKIDLYLPMLSHRSDA